MLYILFFTFVLFIYIFSKNNEKRKGIPIPGIVGGRWPILGFIVHFIRGVSYESKLIEIKNKFGPIACVKMGYFNVIFLNELSIVREAWAHPAFSGRPAIPGVIERTHGFKGGIIFNDGSSFKEQRSFCLKHLKEFGFGKRNNERIENAILTEVQSVMERLKNANGRPMTTKGLFNIPILNCLWEITTGEKYSNEDSELNHLIETLSRNMELGEGVKASFFIPWVGKYFPKWSGYGKYVKDAQDIFIFWQKFTMKRIENLNLKFKNNEFIPEDNLTDSYILNLILNSADEFNSEKEQIKILNLAASLQDLFIAGSETTATTLCWAVLFLAAFPKIQEKVFKEIEKLNLKSIELNHKELVPYLLSFIHETMRFGTLAPLGMIHSTTQDVFLRGHFISKGTIVMANLAAIHKDQQLWGDPFSFRPERFMLNKQFQLHPSFIAFSHGKRKCIGDNLAKDQLFLFIGNLVLNFAVSFSSHVEDHKCLEPIIGVSAVPKIHFFSFIPRIKNMT